jgi:hypothetical protein
MWRFNDELLALAGSKWDDWLPIGEGFYTAPGYQDLVERGAELLREEFGGAPLFVFKDPRNCRLARFWLEVFANEAISLAIVIPIRNPLEVARSLTTRNKADEHYGTLLWLRHVLDAEAASRGTTRVFTSYDQMIECWEVVVAHLQQGLGITWPRMSPAAQEEIGAFIDKRQRHEIATPEAIDDNPTISGWLRRTWAILHRWAVDGENGEDYAELDAIMQGFNEAAPAFARLILRGTQAQNRVDELERTLALSHARTVEIALQTAQQHHNEQEALVQELHEATDRLAEYASRVAEQDSALIQRREENEQAWAALSLEQAVSTDLRSQITDFSQREELLRQRLADAEAWVFRLAKERRTAEQLSKKAAKLQARLEQAAAADAFRLQELARTQARLKERTEEVVTLSQLLQQAELRAISAEAGAARSNELATKYGEVDARLHTLRAEQAEAEGRLRERFSELALLTAMMREQEFEAERQKQHAEWLREIGAVLATRPWWWALMPNAWQRLRDSRRFKRRGLFDADAYRAEHPDVSESGMDPLRHYLLHGYAEGRLPTSERPLREEFGQ